MVDFKKMMEDAPADLSSAATEDVIVDDAIMQLREAWPEMIYFIGNNMGIAKSAMSMKPHEVFQVMTLAMAVLVGLCAKKEQRESVIRRMAVISRLVGEHSDEQPGTGEEKTERFIAYTDQAAGDITKIIASVDHSPIGLAGAQFIVSKLLSQLQHRWPKEFSVGTIVQGISKHRK